MRLTHPKWPDAFVEPTSTTGREKEVSVAANDDSESNPEAGIGHEQGTPIRLAESAIAAVDLCPCGCETLHLHMGALSLRVSAHTLSELLSTFGQAVAALAAYKWLRSPQSLLSTANHQIPGEA